MEQPEQDSSEQLVIDGERLILGGGDGGRLTRGLGGGIGDIRRTTPRRGEPETERSGDFPRWKAAGGDGRRNIRGGGERGLRFITGSGGGGEIDAGRRRIGGGDGEIGTRRFLIGGDGLLRWRNGGDRADLLRLRLRLRLRERPRGGIPFPYRPRSLSELLGSSSMYIFLNPVWRHRFGSFSSTSSSFLSQVSLGKARAFRITLSISLRFPAG